MVVVPEIEFDWTKEVNEIEESKIGIKGLVDSGITTIPRIFHQPIEIISDLKPSASSSSHNLNIPIIDLSGLINSDRRSQIVDQVKEACHTWGFFQVINHGIPKQVIEDTINAVQAFHEQPTEMKKKHYVRDQLVSYSINMNPSIPMPGNWSDVQRLLIKNAINPFDWDKVPMVCKKELMVWDEKILRLGESIMELLCEGLGVGSTRLKELSCLDLRAITGIYYPYCPQPDLTLGLQPHADKLILTMLIRSHSEDGGLLHVKHGSHWVQAAPIPGAIIVNVGDLLQIISNDEYKSVVHRVLANPSRDPKISVGVFFGPGKDSDTDSYGPFPEMLSSEKPALYRNFTMPEIYKHSHIYAGKGREMAESFKLHNL